MNGNSAIMLPPVLPFTPCFSETWTTSLSPENALHHLADEHAKSLPFVFLPLQSWAGHLAFFANTAA